MTSYWERRQGCKYYRLVRDWIEDLSPLDALENAGPSDSIIDVGARDTPVSTWGDFSLRYAIDVEVEPALPGVVGIRGDWLTYRPPHRFGVATCLQVLEHLPAQTIRPFVDKLFATSDQQIISVPWKWPADACVHHVHDPIDDEKFAWMLGGRVPARRQIVADSSVERLVALFSEES